MQPIVSADSTHTGPHLAVNAPASFLVRFLVRKKSNIEKTHDFPTRTNCLPKLAPLRRPMNAAGAPSRPSVTNSLYLTLPSRTHPDISRRKSAWRAAKSLTVKPRIVRRLVSTAGIFADAQFGGVSSVLFYLDIWP